MSEEVVMRARSLVGCRFRAQGRDQGAGLDCIGLVCAAFDLPVDRVPRDYRLRSGSLVRLTEYLAQFFRPVPPRSACAGDVLVLGVADDQLHLAILTPRGFVHADAGLRKVVETPGVPEWPLLSVHRCKGL